MIPGSRFLSRTRFRTNPLVPSLAVKLDEKMRLGDSIRRKGFLRKLRRERILGAGGEGVSTDSIFFGVRHGGVHIR